MQVSCRCYTWEKSSFWLNHILIWQNETRIGHFVSPETVEIAKCVSYERFDGKTEIGKIY